MTVTFLTAVSVAPWLSVTTSTIVNVSDSLWTVKSCAKGKALSDEVWPSPKVHKYDAIVPSGSCDAVASSVTWSSVAPSTGSAVKLATGSRFMT